MAEENDMDELAKRFLDLWQDQAQAVAEDLSEQGDWANLLRGVGFPAGSEGAAVSSAESLAAQWATWPAMMAAAAAAVASTAGTAAGKSTDRAEGMQDDNECRRENTPGRAPSSGAKTASASSGGGLHDLDKLLRRIDTLEKRLAALESKKPRRR